MNDAERQLNYKQHRLRVQKATSLVNSQAPKPQPTSEERKHFCFMEMMNALMCSARQAGKHKKNSLKMTEIGARFPCKDLEKIKRNKLKDWAIPLHVWRRYEHLHFMQDWNLMQKLLRPQIFVDLVCNGQPPLGRLVVQLFTEACPEVVLQFVQVCRAKQHDHFNITRLLFPLWLEAQLQFDDRNALKSSQIAHDPLALNHGNNPCVLSLPSRYLRGSRLNSITFTVSFTALEVVNGKRVAFGLITSGQKVLERMQSLEVTRGGKPCKNIVVSACGAY